MKRAINLFLLIAPFVFSGCMSIFNVGYDKGICEEQGCDYKDAGVCGNSYDIYKDWRKAKKEAYIGYKCKKNQDGKTIIIEEE